MTPPKTGGVPGQPPGESFVTPEASPPSEVPTLDRSAGPYIPRPQVTRPMPAKDKPVSCGKIGYAEAQLLRDMNGKRLLPGSSPLAGRRLHVLEGSEAEMMFRKYAHAGEERLFYGGIFVLLVPTFREGGMSHEVLASRAVCEALIPAPSAETVSPHSVADERRQYPAVAASVSEVASDRADHLKRWMRGYTPLDKSKTAWARASPARKRMWQEEADSLLRDFLQTDLGKKMTAEDFAIRFEPEEMDRYFRTLAMIDEGSKTIRFGTFLLSWAAGRAEWFGATMFHEYSHPRFREERYRVAIEETLRKTMEELKLGDPAFAGELESDAWGQDKVFFYPVEEMYVLSEELTFVEERLRQARTTIAREQLVALRDEIRTSRLRIFQQIQNVFSPKESVRLLTMLEEDRGDKFEQDPEMVAFLDYEKQFVDDEKNTDDEKVLLHRLGLTERAGSDMDKMARLADRVRLNRHHPSVMRAIKSGAEQGTSDSPLSDLPVEPGSTPLPDSLFRETVKPRPKLRMPPSLLDAKSVT